MTKLTDDVPVTLGTEYDRLKAQKDAILAKRESRIIAALREQHEWHLAQTDADVHGVIPAEAYSESGMCDRTTAALSDTHLTSQPTQSDLVERIENWREAPSLMGAVDLIADLEGALSTPTAPQPDRESVLREVEQEYRWGNLTKVGVVNHLRRGGFNFAAAVRHAERIVPDTPGKPTQNDAAEDSLPIGCVVGTGSGTAMCSRGQPRFGGDCIYPECEALATTAPQPDRESVMREALNEVRSIALSYSNMGHAEGNKRAFAIIGDIDRRLALLTHPTTDTQSIE